MRSPSRRPADARRAGRRQAGRKGGPSASRPATRQRRRHAARPSHFRIGWSRRIGAALGLLAVGATIVLAGQTLDDGSLGVTPEPSASRAALPPAPELSSTAALVAAATIDVTVELPGGLSPPSAYRLRIYVNDELARERRLPRETPATIRAIPLDEGDNWVSAAIAGPDGEGLHSAPVHVVRDAEPPPIHVSEPPDRTVHAPQVTLRGRTEAGSRLVVRNAGTGEAFELEIGADGRFELGLELALGANEVTLRATDAAGNRGRATIVLTRRQSKAAVTLEPRPSSVALDDLPETISLHARISGLHGEPADGARVTFSLSVPGQQTTTYTTSSSAGLAIWRGIRIPADGALAGQGLATIMVVLDDGQGGEVVLQESAAISFR